MTTKLADSKGRILLGAHFANRMMLVDDSDPDRIVLTPAVAIPAKEAWLYENEKALADVRLGLEQAKSRKFKIEAPDLKADATLADRIPDN